MSSSISLPDPDKFNGSPSEIRPFLRALMNKINGTPALFPNEETKIRYAYGCLSNSARDRMDLEFRFLADPTLPVTMRTVQDFMAKMTLYFDDPARAYKADQKLGSIRQANRPFHAFLAEFEETLNESSSASFPREAFVPWINVAISDELRQAMATLDPPSDYIGFVALCQKIDAKLAAGRRSIAPRKITSPASWAAPWRPKPQPTTIPPPEPTTSQGGNRMDLDLLSQEKENGRLTPRAKEARRALGRCLRCNQSGHFVSTCPTLQQHQIRLAALLSQEASSSPQPTTSNAANLPLKE